MLARYPPRVQIGFPGLEGRQNISHRDRKYDQTAIVR